MSLLGVTCLKFYVFIFSAGNLLPTIQNILPPLISMIDIYIRKYITYMHLFPFILEPGHSPETGEMNFMISFPSIQSKTATALRQIFFPHFMLNEVLGLVY